MNTEYIEKKFPYAMTQRQKDEALRDAILVYDLETVKAALAIGADVEACDTYKIGEGMPPLMIAALGDDENIVKALIEAGADVDAENWIGSRALHYAAREGRLSVVKVLIEAGADVNAQNDMGFTPLYEAAASNNYGVVMYLLAHCADADLEDRFGDTPRDIAEREGFGKIAEALRKHESCREEH